MSRPLAAFLLLMVMSGCVPQAFTLVTPGAVTVGSVTIQVEAGWNEVNPAYVAYLRKGGATWTRDGLLLNRIIVVPSTAAGEPLFKEPKASRITSYNVCYTKLLRTPSLRRRSASAHRTPR